MRTYPNEREIILSTIAPKDYKRSSKSHCGMACWNVECVSHRHDMKG